MGRRRRRRNRGRSTASRILDPAGIFSRKRGKKRGATSQATKAAVVTKKGDAQQAQASNLAAQQVQNQQAQGAGGPQIGGAAGIAPRPASAGGGGGGGGKGMVGALAGGRRPARPGRGRGESDRMIDRGTGGRDFGGGYRNRGFGMGRGERGYGMDRGRGGMTPDFMGGGGSGGRSKAFGMGRGGRGFGMGGGGRDVMQSDAGGYGRRGQYAPSRQPQQDMSRSPWKPGRGGGKGGQRPLPRGDQNPNTFTRPPISSQGPQGRPNPYAGMGGGMMMNPNANPAQEQANLAQIKSDSANQTGMFGPMQPGRGGGGRGGSSYNPGTGRMEYASTPSNFSQRSQRGGGGRGRGGKGGQQPLPRGRGGGGGRGRRGGGGFRGRRSAAFPTMAAMSMFSDIRMKENIERTGTSLSGIPIYEFNYIDDNNRYNGAIAQDLLAMGKKDAVHKDKETGYYKIDYSQIDVSLTLKN